MDILAEQTVMRWVIVDSKEGRSVDRIWSAYETPSSTALYWTLTSVAKFRTVWRDSAQVEKCPMGTIGASLVMPAPFNVKGRVSINDDNLFISMNAGCRKGMLDGSWG